MIDDTLKDSWQPEGPISKTIKERIKKAGKIFHSNDNIAEFIKDGEMDIKDGTIKEIIRSYTRESGVRNLEREISKITRKVVKKVVNNEETKVEVNEKNISDNNISVAQYL